MITRPRPVGWPSASGLRTKTRETIDAEPRPRPVFCVIDHAYRDIARAEAICAGRFTHAGITLDLGVEPDWLRTDLRVDDEWRIEWHKFYYGLDLAQAFVDTGEARFLRAWERLVLSWIRQTEGYVDKSDVIGRRVQNWIYAWNRFAAASAFGGLSEGSAETILASLGDQVAHLREHLTAERNHRTLELYALFIAALALPMLADRHAVLEFATHELQQNLLVDVRADGVHRESSSHYHLIALRTFLAARENGRRFGVHFSADYDDRLLRACEFAMHCHRPDGAIPALSDSDTGTYLDLLELAASLFDRADFRYVATAGASGVPPEQRYVSFPDSGYFVQRSGWGATTTPFRDERFLIFDCGPLGDGGHGHYDLLSVEVAASGHALVVDPGRYTYSEEPPNWRRWFKGTAAHNTVCVDRRDQTPYALGRPRGPAAQGRIRERLSAPGLDAIWGEARSPVYEAVHTRGILFVADEYWIVADRLRGTARHHYDVRFHLAPEAVSRVTTAIDGDNTTVRAPGVALVLWPARPASIEPGWVAPQYGTKLAAPVVSVVAEDDNADFFTLIVPLEASRPAPTLGIRDDRAKTGATVAELRGTGSGTTHDFVGWSPTPLQFAFAPVECRARAVWLRTSALGEPLAFLACLEPDAAEDFNAVTRWVRWTPQTGLVRGSGAAA